MQLSKKNKYEVYGLDKPSISFFLIYVICEGLGKVITIFNVACNCLWWTYLTFLSLQLKELYVFWCVVKKEKKAKLLFWGKLIEMKCTIKYSSYVFPNLSLILTYIKSWLCKKYQNEETLFESRLCYTKTWYFIYSK